MPIAVVIAMHGLVSFNCGTLNSVINRANKVIAHAINLFVDRFYTITLNSYCFNTHFKTAYLIYC